MKRFFYSLNFPYQRYRSLDEIIHGLSRRFVNWSVIAFIGFFSLPLYFHFKYQWALLDRVEHSYSGYATAADKKHKPGSHQTELSDATLSNELNNTNGVINSVNNNAGFITSVIGVLLVSYSLIYQARNTRKNGFKENFFRFLTIHRENLDQVTTKGKKGHDAFIAMYNEIVEIIPVVESGAPFLSGTAILGVAYLAFFWGVGKTSTPILKESLTKNYTFEIDSLNTLIEALEKLKEDRNKEIEDATDDPEKKQKRQCLLDGHQSDLGHYFRHLYQTVKFIGNETSLWMHEKYEYGKTLRAQFSNHEQAVFFFNANSPLGRKWEPENARYNKKLISYYALVKNMPPSLIPIVDIRTLYPTLKFDFDDESNKP